jgi:hypothetical protein
VSVLPPSNATVIGIDVGGSRKGFHAVALADGAYTAQLHSRDVQDIVHWCRERIGASVIALDTPCRWSTTGRMRPCERELMQQGIFCFATPSLEQAERHPSNYGKPMSSQQFIELLYGQLPEFVQDEAELRRLWSAPDTRTKLLQGLAEKGFGAEQLAEMQSIISAEHSDLFDVLAHVAYALPPIPRETRAQQARLYIHSRFTSKQQLFLDFVLQHYVSNGVQELAQEKLTPLLRIRYQNSIADAVADLGKPEEIGQLFASFQRYLYERSA